MQGPTILELGEPEHQVYRKLYEYAFALPSMRRCEVELVGPLVERTVDRLLPVSATAGRGVGLRVRW